MQFSELLERHFQLALADEAPGSNHVGNDIDAQVFVHVFSSAVGINLPLNYKLLFLLMFIAPDKMMMESGWPTPTLTLLRFKCALVPLKGREFLGDSFPFRGKVGMGVGSEKTVRPPPPPYRQAAPRSP
jgi:hypothetical protein